MFVEIGNRIYDFAQEHRHVFLAERDDGCKDWTECHRERQFRGLTEVCRKIRTEVLPLYNKQTKVHISLDELESYLQNVLQDETLEHEDVVDTVPSFKKPSILQLSFSH